MSTEEKTILRIRDIAKTAVPSGSKAILYGSRARGDARKNSDWDILILLDKDHLEQSDYDHVSYPFLQECKQRGHNISITQKGKNII